MRQSDYLWVVIERKNTRSKSKSKKFKSPTHSNKLIQTNKCLVNGEQTSLSKEKEKIRRMDELEKQNRILRKENEVLREYFYTMDKAQIETESRHNQNIRNQDYEENPQLSYQTFAQPQSFVQHSKISGKNEAEEKGETTTVHSYEGNPHKVYSFGWNKK